MHYIVKQALLGSIQTLKSVLSGMEILINSAPVEGQSEAPKAVYQPVTHSTSDDWTKEDEQAAAKAIGLKFDEVN